VSLYITDILTKVKAALASRYVFDNWFSLLIKYALTRLGFNVKLTARVGNCTLELSPEVFERLVGRFSRGLFKSIERVNGRLFINGVEVDSINDLIYNVGTWAKVLGWVYDSVNKYWFKNNVKLKQIYNAVFYVFDYGDYEPLNVKGKIVIDVGAFVGDSAIYFALRGAKRVIAIEPHPGAFAEMLDNIKLNNMEGVIVPVNAGLASRPGKICIGNIGVEATGGIYHGPGDCPNAIPAVTLGELMDRFGIGPNDAVLKMDCEGCEHDVILNDYEHVRLFRELILEYHSNANKLLKVLSKDYRCDVRGIKILGIMHCTRK